ncbi:MAG: signal peptidase II [Hyphomicrobium sp.]|uniref:signal peptidase II n=1 Tax=Hyphomicrobium sp. TaxID=82 RepID=UPI00132C0E3D|nr:signal peptidase II [Hyphomicrobium sp.]KAB2942296.1 MAG: signal peptidase II [Hyphomicrobium sp.]MBZ0209262.1 signal peptidase II [Hyphomicrobium sp.]
MEGQWAKRLDAALIGTKNWMDLGVVAAAVVFADVLSKQVAVFWLSGAPLGVAVTPFFNLRLSYNSGISFSLLSATGPGGVIGLLAFAAVMVVALARSGVRASGAIERIGYGLIIGGALGNMVDRARDGFVSDFIDAHAFGWHWPSFNLADVAITCGTALILVSCTVLSRADPA